MSFLTAEQLAAIEKWRERKFPKGIRCPLCSSTSWSLGGPTEGHPFEIRGVCDYCGLVLMFSLSKIERTAAL